MSSGGKQFFSINFPKCINLSICVCCLTITQLSKTKKDLPINWRKIINKCPPGIVFIFTIVLTERRFEFFLFIL